MKAYEVLISDVRVFRVVVVAKSPESAERLALDSDYTDAGELVEVRDPQVDVIDEVKSVFN